jgi:HEAT repeat protein
MATEAARTDPNADVVARLVSAGERLPEPVAQAILRRGREVVPLLIEVLEDHALARGDAPGGGYAPIHAARVLGDLEASEAIEPMLRVLARCDPMDILHGTLLDVLDSFGPPVLEPALAVLPAAESDDGRSAIACVLSRMGIRDHRVLAVLLRMLEDDVELGAGSLAEYGESGGTTSSRRGPRHCRRPAPAE